MYYTDSRKAGRWVQRSAPSEAAGGPGCQRISHRCVPTTSAECVYTSPVLVVRISAWCLHPAGQHEKKSGRRQLLLALPALIPACWAFEEALEAPSHFSSHASTSGPDAGSIKGPRQLSGPAAAAVAAALKKCIEKAKVLWRGGMLLFVYCIREGH